MHTDADARTDADPQTRYETVTRALVRANLEFAAAVASAMPEPVLDQLVSNVARLQLQEDDALVALRRRERGLFAALKARDSAHPA